MPLYEYQCKKCGNRFEKIQKFSAKPVKKSTQCGGPVEHTISAPAVQFKCSGWYVTDYAKKSTAPAGSDVGSKEPKKEDKKSETSVKEGTTKKAEKHK